MNVQTRVELDGNFFRKDPTKTIYANIRDLMDQLAEWGEEQVQGQIAAQSGAMPHYTGWTRDHIVGRTKSLSGKRWAVSAVISANTAGMDRKNAIRTKAAAASIERRWHPFRNVTSALRRARPLLTADLTRGLE